MTLPTDKFALKNEITFKLKQKIGEVTFEIEAVKGKDKVEVYIDEAGICTGTFTIEPYQLALISAFFINAAKEVESL